MSLETTDQQAIERLAQDYRLEDGNLHWANRRRTNRPTTGDIVTGFLDAGGSASVPLTEIEDALKARLLILRSTVNVIRRQHLLSGYDVDILKGFRWTGIDGQVRLYVVKDTKTKTVIPVEDRAHVCETLLAYGLFDKFERNYNKVIDRAIANNEVDMLNGISIRDNEVTVPAFEDYMNSVADLIAKAKDLRIPEPKRLSNDPTVPNFTYFDLESVVEGDCSDWLDWELSMKEYCRPIWRAWFYSIFVAENEGRQLCWLKGEGYDGKSQVGKAIRRVLGTHSTASINKLALSNQFGFSGLYGKRFILYGDCRNPMATHSEKIHQITGGDIVSIEFKNQTPFAGEIYGKLLVCANTDPSINYHERNERSRIIYIPLHDPPERVRRKYNLVGKDGKLVKRDGEEVGTGYPLADRLVEQAYAYLSVCKPYYEELCPNNNELVLPTKMMRMIESSCVSDEVVDYTKFIREELEIDEDAYVDSRDLREAFSEFLGVRADQYQYSGLLRYLENRYKCAKKRIRDGGKRFYTISGVKFASGQFSAPDSGNKEGE